MTEQMEKLVEEIATRLHQFWVDTLRDKTPAGLFGLENEYVELFIARIGKAYANGELKLPGQQWRADFKGYIDREAAVIDGHLTNWEGDELKPICRLIALRKEEEK